MELTQFSKKYAADLQQLLDVFDHAAFKKIVEEILTAYKNNRRIFTMGNGGSHATASHLVCDLNKGCCLDLDQKFKVICLSDNVSSMMAISNDIAYEDVFVEPLKNFFEPGDVVLGISGSGNSPNVLKAIDWANQHNGKTIGLSGYDGGKLADMAAISLVIRIHDMQKVEDLHMIVTHMLMQAVYHSLHSAEKA